MGDVENMIKWAINNHQRVLIILKNEKVVRGYVKDFTGKFLMVNSENEYKYVELKNIENFFVIPDGNFK